MERDEAEEAERVAREKAARHAQALRELHPHYHKASNTILAGGEHAAKQVAAHAEMLKQTGKIDAAGKRDYGGERAKERAKKDAAALGWLTPHLTGAS